MLETNDDAPRFGDFVGIGGTQRDKARNTPERIKLFHRLMRGSILADANGIVREHKNDWQLHQGAQPDGRLHIVRENEEAGAKGTDLGQCICTAPLLSADGRTRTATGYDPVTHLWCANLPTLRLPEHPTRAEAEAGLRLLREAFRTFPFADAARGIDPELGIEVVNIDLPPGMDESAFLVGLFTAICRTSVWLVPGLLVRGPEISGAGTGKGLLVRSICAIAFGVQPRAFTRGGDRQELDKRLASDLIEAAPILFLDNVNGTILRSDILASVLTERPARIRALGRTQMVTLNSTAFIAARFRRSCAPIYRLRARCALRGS